MTDLKIPFNIIDIFGYIFPGSIIFGIFFQIYFWENPINKILSFYVINEESTFLITLMSFIIFYFCGHLVASISNLIYEGFLIKMFFGYPEQNLFSTEELPKWKSLIGYYKPLSKDIQEQINEKFEEINIDRKFSFAFVYVKENSGITYSRLNIFLSLYEFSRNSSMALLLLAVINLLQLNWYFGWSSLIFALILFFRYLKFFRIYGLEVFNTFHYLMISKKAD